MTDNPDISPNLGLPFYQTKLNEFEVQHNEALLMLDALVMLAVIDRDLSAPPSSPSFGDRYLVKPTGTAAFAGNDNRIAQYDIGGWNFYAPKLGWTCYVQDECVLLAWNGTSWAAAFDVMGTVTELQNLSLLGVGTIADGTNPLSAKLNNALFAAKTVAEGGDGTLRYTLSKESASDTLSYLFQDNFSGRAEIGLAGDDDFHFKTSGDGSTWVDALILDQSTGAAKLNSALFLTGDIAPSQIAANQNDYNPSGLSQASVLRLSSDASRDVTGLSGGGGGRVLAVVNVGANAIVLKDANTSSSAGNRFSFGADVTLSASQSAVLWYDATDSRWKLLAGPQTGGSGPADLDVTLAELAIGLADALNVAQFLGSAGNRFADSFDVTTWVDVAGSTALDSGTAGLLKPTVASGASLIPTMTSSSTSGVTVSTSDEQGTYPGWKAADGTQPNSASSDWAMNGTPSTGTPGMLTVDLGSGRTAAQYVVGASGNAGNALQNNMAKDWKLQGSNDNSSYTDLDTQAAAPAWSAAENRTYTVVTPGSYRYYRIRVTASENGSTLVLGKLQLVGAGSTNNVTAKSVALTAASAPSSARIVAQTKHIDSITLGTDLMFDVSRDDGTTWSAATMNDRFTSNSIHVLESASIDVSAQPSGTSVKWRIRTANNKMAEIHGIYVYWS